MISGALGLMMPSFLLPQVTVVMFGGTTLKTSRTFGVVGTTSLASSAAAAAAPAGSAGAGSEAGEADAAFGAGGGAGGAACARKARAPASRPAPASEATITPRRPVRRRLGSFFMAFPPPSRRPHALPASSGRGAGDQVDISH